MERRKIEIEKESWRFRVWQNIGPEVEQVDYSVDPTLVTLSFPMGLTWFSTHDLEAKGSILGREGGPPWTTSWCKSKTKVCNGKDQYEGGWHTTDRSTVYSLKSWYRSGGWQGYESGESWHFIYWHRSSSFGVPNASLQGNFRRKEPKLCSGGCADCF